MSKRANDDDIENAYTRAAFIVRFIEAVERLLEVCTQEEAESYELEKLADAHREIIERWIASGRRNS